MSKKRSRAGSPKRALPSMSGFASPETRVSPSRTVPSAAGFASPVRRHTQARRVRMEPPDQRERYLGRRARLNPEMRKSKLLWMAPDLVFRKYGLKGFLWILKFETYDTGSEGTYNNNEVDQIKIIFNNLSRLSFEDPEEVRRRIAALTVDTTALVKTNVMKLWLEYSSISLDLRF